VRKTVSNPSAPSVSVSPARKQSEPLTPPGSFVAPALADDCARFLAESRRRAHARSDAMATNRQFH
jgi:hypothetical protein